MTTEPWALILAGGDGCRLQPLTEAIAGGPHPKQYCPLIDGETLLERTRRRVDLAARWDRQVVIVTRTHESHYQYLLRELAPGRLVVQPENRGTGVGIVFALLRVLELVGNVPIAIFPSDHSVSDDCKFMGYVARALDNLDALRNTPVLLGMEPTYAETEYGWIEPGRIPLTNDGEAIFAIRRFWEKPAARLAEKLLAGGGLWNTFVMVGWVGAFLNLVQATCPGLLAPLRRIQAALGSPDETPAVATVFRRLPAVSFSKSVLARAPHRLATIRVEGVEWSDLGSVRRVVESLRRAGRRPLWLSQAESMLIAGCATSRVAYTKVGATDEERKRDQAECLKTAIGHADGREHILEPVTIDRDVFQGCLESRGYVRASN